MIRPNRFVTKTCSMCQRPGWTSKVPYSLLTQEELTFDLEVKNLPIGFTPMYAGCGSDIYSAVREAIEFCQTYKVRGVGFDFNDKLVTVTAKSSEKSVVDTWWVKTYNETPEESFARR
jgi:hypothetical protein